MGKLRTVYWLAIVNLIVAIVCFLDIPGIAMPITISPELMRVVYALWAIFFVPSAVPLIILLLWPRGWGRLLLPFYGSGWMMLGVVSVLRTGSRMTPPRGLELGMMITCGIVFLALAVAHHLIHLSGLRAQPA